MADEEVKDQEPETEPEPDEPTEPVEPEDSPEDVSRAKALGWRPKEEYTGRPDNWVSAKEYLNDSFPKLRERVRTLEAEIRAELDKQKQFTQYHREKISQIEEMAYKRALADIKAERRKAVVVGDAAEIDRLDTEYEGIVEERAKNVGMAPQTQQIDPRAAAWFAKHPAYQTDPRYQAKIDSVFSGCIADGFNPQDLNNLLPEMDRRLAALDKKPEPESPTRKAGAGVAGAQRGGSPKGTSLYSRLDADAKKVCDGFVKNHAIEGYTKEDWARDYLVGIGESV